MALHTLTVCLGSLLQAKRESQRGIFFKELRAECIPPQNITVLWDHTLTHI